MVQRSALSTLRLAAATNTCLSGRVRFMLLCQRECVALARCSLPSCKRSRRGACSPPCGFIVNASGVWPNLSLNPDASPAALTRRPLGAG